jgi:hypothetical protein
VNTDDRLEMGLDESRPEDLEITAAIGLSLEHMVDGVASAPLAPRGRRSWLKPIYLVPTIGVLAIATTAGAVAYSFSKNDAAVIPINYTTSSGQDVSCGYGLSGFQNNGGNAEYAGAAIGALRQYVQSHDWSGTGENVYRYALAHPYVPTASEKSELTQEQIDSFSFSRALSVVIGDEIPVSVEPSGYLAGGESNCLGTLR